MSKSFSHYDKLLGENYICSLSKSNYSSLNVTHLKYSTIYIYAFHTIIDPPVEIWEDKESNHG
jgi:hypothetical protein